MSGTLQRTIVAAALVLVTILAVGCGGGAAPAPSSSAASSHPPTPATVLSAAQKATRSAGSARVSIDISISGTPSGPFSEVGTGAFDFARHTGALAMRLEGLGTNGRSGTIQVILDRAVIYEKLPPKLLGGQAAKPWLKIDLSKTALGSLAGTSPSTSDPTESLTLLEGAAGPVSDLGRGSVRGVSCEHYRFTVDLASIAKTLPASQRALFEQYAKTFATTSFPTDVWIDGSGRLRKMTFAATVNGASQGGSPGSPTRLTETIEYYDFGVPVKLSIPPADQITDLTGLLPTPTP